MRNVFNMSMRKFLKEVGVTSQHAIEQVVREEKREQVDRLFRLSHATRLNQYDAAFRALNRALRLNVEGTISRVSGARISKSKRATAKSKSAAA